MAFTDGTLGEDCKESRLLLAMLIAGAINHSSKVVVGRCCGRRRTRCRPRLLRELQLVRGRPRIHRVDYGFKEKDRR